MNDFERKLREHIENGVFYQLETVSATNIDRIRTASEDDLIEWYCRHRDCGTCDYGHDVECSIRAWLKSPVEVENDGADK